MRRVVVIIFCLFYTEDGDDSAIESRLERDSPMGIRHGGRRCDAATHRHAHRLRRFAVSENVLLWIVWYERKCSMEIDLVINVMNGCVKKCRVGIVSNGVVEVEGGSAR